MILKISQANKQTQNKIKTKGQMGKINKYFTPSIKLTERRRQISENREINYYESTAANRLVNLEVEQETHESRGKYE